MAKDFRSDQIRAARLIASGAFPPGTNVPSGQTPGSGPAAAAALRYPHLGMLIYSSSVASDTHAGLAGSGILNHIGHDAWLVISGSSNNTAVHGGDRAKGSAVVFTGDIVVSGTIWGQRQIIDVDNTVPGDFHVYDNAYVSGSIATGNANPVGAPANRDIFAADHTNNIVSFGQFDVGDFRQFSTPNHHEDVFFWVSGSNTMGSALTRSVACFDGDIMISGAIATGPCTTFRDSIRLGDPTSSNPPVLIFGPSDNCWPAAQIASASISYYAAPSATNWFSLVNSQSTNGGIRLINPRGGNVNAGFVVSGTDGSIAIDPGSSVNLTGGNWHGAGTNIFKGAKIFATASVAGNRNRGVQVQYIATGSGDGSQHIAGSHWFRSGIVTASAGIFLPLANPTDAETLGQSRGIMFAGGDATSANGAPGDTGIFFNSVANQNPLFTGVGVGKNSDIQTKVFVITSSHADSNIKIGVGKHINIQGGGDVVIESKASAANLIFTASAVVDTLLSMGAEETKIRGSKNIYLQTVTGTLGGIQMHAPQSQDGINISSADGVHGIHINASGSSGGRVIGGHVFGMTLDASGSKIGMVGDVHMWNNLTVHGDFIKGHVVTASVEDPLLLLNSGSLSRNSGGGIAIASGSTVTNEALVFGRDTTNENTFVVGRLDVLDGVKGDLAGTVVIPVHAAGYRMPQGMVLSSSLGWPAADAAQGGGAIPHVTMSSPGATSGFGADLHLIAGPGGGASPVGGQLFVSASTADFTGNMAISGSYVSILSTSILHLQEGTRHGGPYFLNVDTGNNVLHLGLGTTAGKFQIGANSIYSESTKRLGINQITPGAHLHATIEGSADNIPIAMFEENQSGNIRGPSIQINNLKGGSAGAAGDIAGTLDFNSPNSAGTKTQFAQIKADVLGAGSSNTNTGSFSIGLIRDAIQHEPVIIREAGQMLLLSGCVRDTYAAGKGPATFADAALFVAGKIGSAGTKTRGTAVFGGDLVVSGNIQAKGEVTASVVNVLGALTASDLKLPRLSLTASTADITFFDTTMFVQKNSNNLEFRDSALGLTKTLTQLASLSVVDNTDVFSVTHGAPSYIVTSGSFSFDTKERPTNVTPAPDGPGRDTYFFVSGSRGCRGTNDRGLSLFAGDLHVSGTLTSDDTTFGGSLQDAYMTPSGGGTALSGSGGIINVGSGHSTQRPGPPLQLQSGSVRYSSGNEFLLAASGSVALGNLKVLVTQDGGGIADNGTKLQATGSAGDFKFGNVSTTQGDATIFKITGGSGNIQVNAHATEGKIAFANESSTYIRLDNASSPKDLQIYNITSTGKITLKTGTSAGAPGTVEVQAHILPTVDNSYNLGSATQRFANLYTGDLHLRNDRGDWTIYEEPDMLVVVNNLTGKKYKMNLTPLEDEE